MAFVTNSIKNDVSQTKQDVSRLRETVERLEQATAQQTEEIRALREVLEASGARTGEPNR